MTFVFLIALTIGLLLAVRIMLFGIEREGGPKASAHPTVRSSIPAVGAFAFVFGVVGYLLVSRSSLSPMASMGTAMAVGFAAAVLAAWGSVRWARVTPEHDPEDPRYVLQGLVVQVTGAISAESDGEILLDLGDERRVLRARSIGELPVLVDTEVVIDRIEDDVAYVEPWVQVEKRL